MIDKAMTLEPHCLNRRDELLYYYRKLTRHEIKVLEINANLMENNFRIKKIDSKDEVEFHNKGN